MRKINQSYEYCEDQDAWIREHLSGKITEDLVDQYNRKFSLSRSKCALKNRANRLGVRPKLKLLTPFESEKLDKDGRALILVSTNPHCWMGKARLIYQKFHNCELSPNEVILMLDGNLNNYEIDNLYKVTRSENLAINRLKSKYPDTPLSTLLLMGLLDVKVNNLEGRGDWSDDEILWVSQYKDSFDRGERTKAFNRRFNKKRSPVDIAMMASVLRRRE